MDSEIEIDLGESISDGLEENLCETSSRNTEINRYDTEISYNQFFFKNLVKNEPCIFGDWLTNNWLSSKNWVCEDGTPNHQYLNEMFGAAEVPVADCSCKHFDSQKKETFLFKEFLKYFTIKKMGEDTRCLYLKDWHFTKDFPLYKAYVVPAYFSSDWLNEFWTCKEDSEDDYKFVYIGPQGSWTPFHADVFRSFSWSANICGQKRWIFYPPTQSAFLRDKFGNLIYDVESSDLKDASQFPKADLATKKIEVIQEKGETIFVPSNWHHQVFNMKDTISINHNWINGSNIESVLDYFLSSLQEVERAIEDCREMDGWVGQCQLILKSTYGMDAQELCIFLKTIADRRMRYLKGDKTLSSFSEWKFGKNHVMYDVRKLILCLNRIQNELPSYVRDFLEESYTLSHIIDELESFL